MLSQCLVCGINVNVAAIQVVDMMSFACSSANRAGCTRSLLRACKA